MDDRHYRIMYVDRDGVLSSWGGDARDLSQALGKFIASLGFPIIFVSENEIEPEVAA